MSLRNTTGWVAPRRRGMYAADISTHRDVWALPHDYGAILSEAIYQAEWSYQDPVHDMAVELNKKIKAQKGVWGIFGTKTFSLPKAIAHYDCKVVSEIPLIQLFLEYAHLDEMWHYLQSLFVQALALEVNKFQTKFQ